MIEQLLAEGDEDALVAHQFEEALIDTMQGDPEMTALMGTYLDARRKLTEKSHNRGFWPIRSKGMGKTGKSKTFPFRSRKPLAVRIAESECRHCGQQSHWRAECPKRLRNQPSASVSKLQPANMLISASGRADDDDEDVFVMEPTGSVLSDVFVFGQDPGGIKQGSHSHNCYVSWSHKGIQGYKGLYYQQVCQRLHRVLKSSATQHPCEPLVPCATPSFKECHAVQCSSQAISRPTHVDEHPRSDVRPKADTEHVGDQECETMFATARTLGILDLGASLTVMEVSFCMGYLKPFAARCSNNQWRCHSGLGTTV